MARVQYTTEELQRRGIAIVKDAGLAKGLKKCSLNMENKLIKTWPILKPDPARDIELYNQTGLMAYEAPEKMWIFPVPPMPAPRLTQNQTKLVYIHDSALDRVSLAIKRRVLAYAAFKEALRLLAAQNRFPCPQHGFAITFWFKHRLDKPELQGAPHQNKPDLDNCLKAFKDALYSQDQRVWDYRVTKRWCVGPEENARIEVHLM